MKLFQAIATMLGIGNPLRTTIPRVKELPREAYEPAPAKLKHSDIRRPSKRDNPNVKVEEMLIQPFGFKKPVRAIVTKTWRRCARLRGAGKMWIITGVQLWPWTKGQQRLKLA